MRAFDDLGFAVAANKPLRLPRREANRLPDPAQCVDCLIIVNDRHDGVPRARLAMSNGASWDHVAWLADIPAAQTAAVAPSTTSTHVIEAQAVDLTPFVDQIRRQVLAALPKPDVRVLSAPQVNGPDVSDLASAMLEMSEHVNRIAIENAELKARLDVLESCAIAEVRQVR